jgi:hypothetical protein
MRIRPRARTRAATGLASQSLSRNSVQEGVGALDLVRTQASCALSGRHVEQRLKMALLQLRRVRGGSRPLLMPVAIGRAIAIPFRNSQISVKARIGRLLRNRSFLQHLYLGHRLRLSLHRAFCAEMT